MIWKQTFKFVLLFFIGGISLSACSPAVHRNPTSTPTTLPNTTKRLAFYSDTIYVINSDGSALTQLSNLRAKDPSWSPNGQYIAFVGRDTNVYVKKVDDNDGPIRLSDFGNIDDPPSWSPDGQQLVFTSYTGDGEGGLYSVDIGNVLESVNNKGPMRLNVVGLDAQNPIWSPDGREIAFFYREEYHEPFKIVVVNIAALQNPNQNAWFDLSEGTQPAWSPDSQRIVFVSWSKDEYRGIYVMNADGSDQSRLTQPAALDMMPIWSPDGLKISFVSERDDNQEIYFMNADGSQQTRLTNDPAEDTSPVWSPDSKQIAFVSKRDGNQEIYVMNADGSDQRRLTNTPEDEWDPVWAPQ